MKHNWEYKRLGDIAPAMPFKGTITSSDGKYWCLNLDKIESNTGVVLEYDFIEESELGGSVHKFTVDNVLFSKLRPNLNKVVVPEQNGYCTTELIPLHPLDILNRHYLAYYLRSPKYVNFLIGKTGGAKMPRVKMDIFWNSTIPVPPMETQEQIVAELDQVNDLIAKNRKLLLQLDALAQSLFYDTFGDPISNHKGWDVHDIKSISEILRDGPFGSNLKSSHYTDCGIRVIRLQNIGVGYFDDEDKTFISEDYYPTISKYTCYPGDVILGTLGNPNLRACIVPSYLEKAIHKADCVRLVPDRTLLESKYVEAYFNNPSVLSMASKDIHGATRARISCGQIAKFLIPVPPLALQEDFAVKVEAIEAQKAKVEAEIAELKTLLNARMDYWFN